MKRINRKQLISDIEVLRQGFRTMVDSSLWKGDKIHEVSLRAYHQFADKIIEDLGGESIYKDGYEKQDVKIEKREYILCAATHFDDGEKYPHQPINIESGLVLCGLRHSSIFPQIRGLVGERKKLGIHEKQQGFLTNLNRFVDRKEAGGIAHLAEQTKTLIENLHSEDLY